MPTPIATPYSEAYDSLQRVERAWRGKAGPLPNGNPGNMGQDAVKRCVQMRTLEQLRERIKQASVRYPA